MPFSLEIISTALCVFLLFTETDSNNFFSASRDFLGSLPAIFFAAYRIRGLALIFAAATA